MGVVLLSFILFVEKLEDELLGVFRDTGEGGTLLIGGVRRRRSVFTAQRVKKLKISIKCGRDDRKRRKKPYS